jgi:uncharacterized membrane protein YbhN (UPF0104 family)
MTRRGWPALRLVGGALVLTALLWRFGTGPFAAAGRVTTWTSLLAALVLTAGATVANAWRWRVVAGALGLSLTVAGSLTAYYRSQFLNATLPGGVLGDAHRGMRHGRASGDLGAGLRATVWDRVTGQVVQVAVLVVALLVLPTPLRAYAPVALAVLGTVAALAWWVARRRGRAAVLAEDLRALVRPQVAGRVALASLVSSAGHVAVFAVAARAAGVHLSPALLVAAALSVLVGSAVPLNVAGWGPREGVTAGVFALVGEGSANGLMVSVVFGVLSAVATVPGMPVLLADAVGRRRRHVAPERTRELEEVSGA